MNEKENSLRTLFIEAVEITDAAERAAYLQRACGDDASLRQRVEKLLHAHDDAGEIAAATGGTQGVLPITEKPGDRIGRYKLREQIGQGGCGVVYVAEQEEPVRRRVALKVIKLGMDTKQVVARFEAERQALAMMDHPNIAKVLDAGATDTGRPYFVMELVRGIKITDYCDQNTLSTKQRLDLFIQVCRAIQHAHQKGIIHRDIKPSNILVTLHDGVPVPKVIDFGIAKATEGRLTDLTVYTELHQFIGTPAYMSPEQAGMSGLDIDTRSDIYSLGVLLYELLTGRTPFDPKALLQAGLDQMRRIIREQEPVKPSTRLSTLTHADLTEVARHRQAESPKLIHLVRGDLDWIVMKALEKDRTRRYETANGLAVDIQRHLNHEPVAARPPTAGYRLQKFVGRNKLAVVASSAIAVSLIAGFAISAISLFREIAARERAVAAEQGQIELRQQAEAEKKNAQTEAARSAQVAQFMKNMLQGVGPAAALGRDTAMLREILDQTARRLNDLKGQPAVEADLLATLGNVYSDLGEYTNAATMHGEAVNLRKKFLGAHPDVANSLNDLAKALYGLGKWSEAGALHREALAMRRTLQGDEHPDVATSLNNLADSLRRQRQDQPEDAEAETMYREALAIRRKSLGSKHPEVAKSLNDLGLFLCGQRRLTEAIAAHREAMVIRRTSLGHEHPDVANSLNQLGLALTWQRDYVEAEAVLRESLARRRKLFGREHPDVAHSLHDLASLLHLQGKHTEAQALYVEALAMRRKLLRAEHPDLADTLHNMANLLRDQDKRAAAQPLYREALAIRRKRLHPALADELIALAVVLREQPELPEAEALLREALTIQRKLWGNEHPRLASLLSKLAGVLRAQGKLSEAEAIERESLAIDKAETDKKAAVTKP